MSGNGTGDTRTFSPVRGPVCKSIKGRGKIGQGPEKVRAVFFQLHEFFQLVEHRVADRHAHEGTDDDGALHPRAGSGANPVLHVNDCLIDVPVQHIEPGPQGYSI